MKTRVLIVDDSLTIRMDLLEVFRDAGFEATGCETLAAARRSLANGSYTVCILDVMLPDGDGVELLREIRGAPEHCATVVIMLSSESEVRDRIRGLQTGADEYVGKPYDSGYLVAKVRDLVRRRGDHLTAATAAILVIDDSQTFREELRAAFDSAGYHVMTAANGEDGLRTAAAERPDAVVVDGVLPGMDGATVIRHIRLDAALRDIPCLLLTGSLDKEAELSALDAGADGFIRKEESLEIVLAKVAAALRQTSGRRKAEKAASLLSPKKLLAVDDSATYLQELSDALTGEGYNVICARSGEEAIELLAVQTVDCILLDLMMPGIGGQEACRRIKAAPIVRDIPLIILTALEDRDLMIEGLSAGADDYLTKTSDFEHLKARVRAQLRRKQFEDENRRIRDELLRKEVEIAEARAARELADTRRVLVEELEKKNRELESFSYSVSHDLRAPLRAISGFSQLLHDEANAYLSPAGKQHLDRVQAAAARMAELIDDLLELSRVGRAEIHRRSTNLSQLVREVVDELAQREPGRTVRVEIEDGLLAKIDARLMRAAFENLLGNAWKFTSKVETPTVSFGQAHVDGIQAFFIRDNGAGFDMASAGRLFNPFQRLHSA